MRLTSLPLALLFLATVDETHAALSTTRIHQAAIRHSKSLAGNIRLAFRSILVEQPAPSTSRRQTYCSLRKTDEPVGSGHLPIGNQTTPVNNPSQPNPGVPSSGSSTRTRSSKPSATPTVTSPWKLVDKHAGETFFNAYDWFTLPDPTHGNVNYVDEATARANGLAYVNERGNIIMAVETTDQVAQNRQSVRITTKKTFSIGSLLIMSSFHVPTGCGSWPAWWTNGPNWPNGGEIDIFEPINDYTHNQAALHTGIGCRMTSTSNSALGISGQVLFGTDCAAETTGNTGCGIRFNSDVSAGAPFNNNGGGVYAMKWDTTGITIWFFPRGQIPEDIDTETPLPNTWGQPQAHWEAASCDPNRFFNNQVAIFDTTLCGDWAGSAWTGSGIPGQEQSCAERTGFATCQEFVKQRGSAFRDAYWEVEYVKLYSL